MLRCRQWIRDSAYVDSGRGWFSLGGLTAAELEGGCGRRHGARKRNTTRFRKIYMFVASVVDSEVAPAISHQNRCGCVAGRLRGMRKSWRLNEASVFGLRFPFPRGAAISLIYFIGRRHNVLRHAQQQCFVSFVRYMFNVEIV